MELCAVISLSLGDWFCLKQPSHTKRAFLQSPFHKRLTEKCKDGRLFHLSASKKNFQSFAVICRKPHVNFFARHKEEEEEEEEDDDDNAWCLLTQKLYIIYHLEHLPFTNAILGLPPWEQLLYPVSHKWLQYSISLALGNYIYFLLEDGPMTETCSSIVV
jgi:hypothetical protein